VTGCLVPVLPAIIHPSAWKVNSPNFVFTAF
jgi:hypothetical protein